MRLLGISGSLRKASLNSALLTAAVGLAPAGIEFTVDRSLRDLPLYDYDLDGETPPAVVRAFRRAIAIADGLVIATPEYAHGIAGPMKNALDWLVGDVDFPGKPVALWTTSPRATHAPAHLREVLETMSARCIEEASLVVPLLGQIWTAETIAASPEMSKKIRSGMEALVETMRLAPCRGV